jgi:hypothetical protein
MMTKKAASATCWDCKNFSITHDPQRPYGCLSMGFKSNLLPSKEVLRVQGHGCLAFVAKPKGIK